MEKFCSKCGKELVNGKCECCDKEEIRFSKNGIINRPRLKEAAKEKINGNMWNIWQAFLVVMAISSIFGLFDGLIDGARIEIYNDVYYNVVDAIYGFITIPLTAGVSYYVLNVVRDKSFAISDLFKFYKERMWTIILLSILISIFTALWSILFIIPGIIAGLSYSMSTFIFVDGEDTNALDIIKKSKDMMYGYKWDYFVFQLSFIGWALLCLFIFPIIYVLPYYYVAETMYYEELKAIKES